MTKVRPPDYKNKGRISEGWWGETFKAESKIDRGLYCIKRFKPHALRERGVIDRELDALKALPRHRNILSYCHSTRVNDTFFTVREFIDAKQLVEEMPAPTHLGKVFVEANVLAWTQNNCLKDSCICTQHRPVLFTGICTNVIFLSNIKPEAIAKSPLPSQVVSRLSMLATPR